MICKVEIFITRRTEEGNCSLTSFVNSHKSTVLWISWKVSFEMRKAEFLWVLHCTWAMLIWPSLHTPALWSHCPSEGGTAYLFRVPEPVLHKVLVWKSDVSFMHNSLGGSISKPERRYALSEPGAMTYSISIICLTSPSTPKSHDLCIIILHK